MRFSLDIEGLFTIEIPPSTYLTYIRTIQFTTLLDSPSVKSIAVKLLPLRN